jgi:hypothetical protein
MRYHFWVVLDNVQHAMAPVKYQQLPHGIDVLQLLHSNMAAQRDIAGCTGLLRIAMQNRPMVMG